MRVYFVTGGLNGGVDRLFDGMSCEPQVRRQEQVSGAGEIILLL
jgi:hypothetical protein